jgi:predicted transposase/invertase (TIGR01784 family)
MKDDRTLISFDWATKKFLRQKANFDILEGFLTELTERSIQIIEILESEGNKETQEDKYNRVDLLCKDSEGEIIIIEVQFYLELDYFHRILYGISKVITEYIHEKQDYSHVKKVISVNIAYFDLGDGKDYIYQGTTNFVGKNLGDQLTLGHFQQKKFGKNFPSEIYPEIYLIKVNNFNDVSKTPLDEWIYFLKNTALPQNYSARGLKEVEIKLKYEQMNTVEKQEYDTFIKNVRISKSVIESERYVAKEEGREEGFIKFILQGFDKNHPISLLSDITELSEEEITRILKENGRMK